MRYLGCLGLLGVLVGCTHWRAGESDPVAPATSFASTAQEWQQITTRVEGPAAVIGGYGKGCLVGGQSLPPDGEGFSVMRPARRRYYGHPELIDFLFDLGRSVKRHRLGVLLVGDLAQARGGPAPGAHLSHQNGLDVDLWFLLAANHEEQRLTLDERENLAAPSILTPQSGVWSRKQLRLLKLIAQDARVERVFVHPQVKIDLCQSKRLLRQKKNHHWLRKIRPWYKHDDHLHVRLRCPDDSPLCRPQAALPEGVGCDSSLEWWKGQMAVEELNEEEQTQTGDARSEPIPSRVHHLPLECQAVLNHR